MRGLSERSLLIGDAASELASRCRGGCQGWSGKRWFWHAFLGNSRPGGEKRKLYGVSRHPWSASPPSAAFFPESEDFLHQHFAIEVAAAAFSAILIGLTTQLGAAGGGLLEGSVGGRKIHFCRREFQFWTSLSRTDPVLNSMILG